VKEHKGTQRDRRGQKGTTIFHFFLFPMAGKNLPTEGGAERMAGRVCKGNGMKRQEERKGRSENHVETPMNSKNQDC
jgi:hypothetical protein